MLLCRPPECGSLNRADDCIFLQRETALELGAEHIQDRFEGGVGQRGHEGHTKVHYISHTYYKHRQITVEVLVLGVARSGWLEEREGW